MTLELCSLRSSKNFADSKCNCATVPLCHCVKTQSFFFSLHLTSSNSSFRDNLFSMTSPLDLGRLARPRTIPQVYTTQLHSYAVTQLHKVKLECGFGRKKIFILYI